MTDTGRVLLQEVVVPRCEGRAVEVRAGQMLRIVALDGPQVADTAFLALDNPREGYHAGQTVWPSTCWPGPERCGASPPCGRALPTSG